MKEVVAKLRYLRITPRKVRLVADLIRKKPAKEALVILDFTNKKAARPLKKLLNSAIANAKNNFQLDPEKLYISKITVDEGPKYKRYLPRARGRADLILKRTSHITLVLAEAKTKKLKTQNSKVKATT
ncbi:MAG: 50S ribosomal protein L22 [Candidatus Pacebacteria bacterium]|nr:50S ribosomal protein L22 [Candidatus Paceibacterota bacterium]